MALPSLDAGDLEALDRLCERGEAVITDTYHQLRTLIRARLAVQDEYLTKGLLLVRPTEEGRKVAAFRKSLKHE